MGLQERRNLSAFEKDRFPALKKRIDELAGFEVAMEIDWAELAKDGYAESYEVAFASNFFVPLAKALESICADQLGKDALREKLKKVAIMSKRSWSSLDVTFDSGILVLDADPSYNRDDSCVDDYTKRIETCLETNL